METGGSPLQTTLPCPRCSGPMTGVEGDAAIACPYCGAGWFRADDGTAGWLLPPRLAPEDAVSPAKRWLRENGIHVTRIGEPEGILLPYRWIRGSRLVWALAQVPRPETIPEDSLLPRRPRTEGEDMIEPRFSVRVYAHTLPAHPLADVLGGRATRLGSNPLALLDPDQVPPGYRLLLAPADDEAAGKERWLKAWESRVGEDAGGEFLARPMSDHDNLVALPAIVIPLTKRGGEEGAVVVDGETGRVLREIPGALWASARADTGGTAALGRLPRGGPALIPLECGTCGWKLDWAERDRLFPCAHCGAAWEMRGAERHRIRQWSLDPGGAGTHRWLPFWVFGPLPRDGIFPSAPLFVPAYAARHPEDQLHLAASLARRPPEGPWLDDPATPRRGAEVGSGEAAAWRWALEGALARASSLAGFARFLKGLDPAPEDAPPAPPSDPSGIVWIPFMLQGGDLIEPQTGARIRAAGTTPWGEGRQAA
jgi:predicted RNA-binding Zn-ribbon protein involved in translation (DUF1610 family)